jgi:hypothetical protein
MSTVRRRVLRTQGVATITDARRTARQERSGPNWQRIELPSSAG